MTGTKSSATDTRITLERVFDAPRSSVWRAWTTPEALSRWWGPEGFTTRVQELDFRPGGRSRYVMVGPDGTEYPVEGVFQEIVPEERIVSTDDFGEDFQAPHGQTLPEGTMMTCLFDDLGDGRTLLTIHLDHPTPEERDSHEKMGVVQGWGSTFDCLDAYLDLRGRLRTGADGEREIVLTRVFAADRSRVFDAWTDPARVKRWMGTPQMPMVACDIDRRVGGKMLYRWDDGSGFSMTMKGTFQQLEPAQKIVHTEVFDEDWTDGEAEVTTTFTEVSEGTEVEMRIRYAARATRDRVSRSPMAEGIAVNYGNLDDLLAR